ncbi:MAG: NAD(P)-binding domain-containing protein [Desulfobacterales bacterium]|jgi:3-hydroxyisobutyrate dehydrogenase-like beta-hydroxyacid dehydrogenase
MTIKLVGIGGMGLMMSPSAKHLKPGSPARYLRIHDRGTKDDRRDACRQAWINHGAEIVHDYEALVGDGDFDGVVVCAGKNGDDCDIFRRLVPLMQQKTSGQPFILHLSTVSAGFAQASYDFLSAEGFDYVNYPLTGGPLGAENANMLILASGSDSIFTKLEPMLQTIGNPRYFGSSITAGAEVKLMGQLMVFNGLLGICSAAALKSECFQEELSGPEQAEFFDFLNGGAGGTRQWDVAISKGVRDKTWDQGFMIHHAVVDAIYAAKLCRERGLPALVVIPMVAIALAFAYLLEKYQGTPLATHAIVREMIRKNASGIDNFTAKHISYTDVDTSIKNAIAVLPQRVKDSVMLEISTEDFRV